MRLSSRAVVAVLAVAALVVPGSPAVGADTREPFVLTNQPGLSATGHGYGHGHGMSQHGAKAAAAAGRSHAWILQNYYPGTALATLKGKIKVLLTGDTDGNTTVRATRGLRVTDTATGRTYRLTKAKPKARAWRLKVVDGRTRVLFRTSSWRVFRPGGRAALAGDGQFSSATNRLTLRVSSADRVYRGALRLSNRKTVNVLGLQAYLKGVVASEMPASWPAHALRAQAVAARTYAARARADNASRYYHICDTTACQVYRGVAAEHPATNDAIDATVGQILTYAGKPAFTQFSASNGGWSSAGSQPYLVARQDPYDTAHQNWAKPVPAATLQAKYGGKVGTVTGIRVSRREGDRAWGAGGWALDVQVRGTLNGTAKTITVPASEIRSLFGLRSTYFTFTA